MGWLFPLLSSAQSFSDSLRKGEACILREDYLSAFGLFLHLTEQLETSKTDSNLLGYSYMHLGNCYEYFDYDKDALLYLEKAQHLFRARGDKKGQALCLAYIGDILEDFGKTKEAMKGYQIALGYFGELRDQKGIALVYDNMASTFETLGQYDSASFYLHKAKSISISIKDSLALTKILNNQGDVYRRWGKLQASLSFYQQAFVLAQKIHSLEEERGNLKDIAKTYAKLGKYEQAYASFEKFFEVHTQLKIENKIDEMARLQSENMRNRKNLEIKAILAEKEVAKLRWIIVVVGLSLVVAILIVCFVAYRIKSQRDQLLAKLEHTRLEKKMKRSDKEKEYLKKELKEKKKKLNDYTDKLIERNQLIEHLKKTVEETLEKEKIEESSRAKTIGELSNASILTDDDWKHFKKKFEDVHTGFFGRLKDAYPYLSTGDMRLAAVMKLKLSQNEIASMMGISEDSVKKAKQRLKSKLSHDPDFKLKDWVETIH